VLATRLAGVERLPTGAESQASVCTGVRRFIVFPRMHGAATDAMIHTIAGGQRFRRRVASGARDIAETSPFVARPIEL
jgi:hypothetical protein